jgi:hypothetical protein
MRVKFLSLATLIFVATPVAASAQGPYVAASVFGDIVRTSHTESSFDNDTGSGEAIGFAVKVGTPVGSTWGVELEFARPSVIRSAADLVYPAIPAALSAE